MGENRNLTSDQEAALSVYKRETTRLGEPPSVGAFALALGKSRNTAHHYIRVFREKGYLSMRPITIIRPGLTAKARKTK